MAPKEVLNDHRRANSVMLVTPLRTYVLVAMHELSAEVEAGLSSSRGARSAPLTPLEFEPPKRTSPA